MSLNIVWPCGCFSSDKSSVTIEQGDSEEHLAQVGELYTYLHVAVWSFFNFCVSKLKDFW